MSAPPPAFHIHSRRDNLAALAAAPLDVLIIGGGINGAGIARDLSLRARAAGVSLSIGLVEKCYFGSGTSSRNSQLIHGGLRYLEQMDFGLVREALGERALLRRLAPALVEPLGFLIPFYGWFDRIYYGLGLRFYDLLAGSRNIGRRRFLNLDEVAGLEPALSREGMHSAAIYFDCRVNSARLLLENIFDAARHGAIAANYVEASSWERSGESFTVALRDHIGGRSMNVQARRLVDARGPWEGGASLRLVRGSHIVLPALTRSGNAIAHFHTDGRIIFFIPWGPQNSLTLVGTTDVDHVNSPDEARISGDEIRYLLGIVQKLFPGAASLEPLAAYSSLRPLVATDGAASKASRTHKIWMEDGIVKITGGKYTTYRSMSAEAVDLLAGEIAPALACKRATEQAPFSPAVVEPTIGQAVKHEMVQRLPDLMFVSTYWGHQRKWDADSLHPIAREMGDLLEWPPERIEEEIALTLRIAAIPNY